jgi:surface protein
MKKIWYINNSFKSALPEFIMLVKTNNSGTSGSNQFTIPTTGTGYNYTVVTSEQTLTNQTGSVTLSWAVAGTYEVKISGSFPRIFFNNDGDRLKLLEVQNWGIINWTSFNAAFWGCSNLILTALDLPNLSNVTNIGGMFLSCTNFNGDISGWNVSNVTVMNSMFNGATAFNQNIGSWNVGNVTNMQSMFLGATSFNQNISSWNVGNVTNMNNMFNGATAFNQNIGSWNVGNVTNMNNMFNGATAFNQNIGSWNVSNVTNMNSMFLSATSFNQNIGSWTVSNVTNMGTMFFNCTSFNQNLSGWNVSNVTDMSSMFRLCSSFNQDISGWNVSNVTNMNFMFLSATSFNQNIGSWNVSNVTNMNSMFLSATSFNQDLSNWQLRTLGVTCQSVFASSGMNTANYTDTLVGWINNAIGNSNLPINVNLTSQSSRTFDNSRSSNNINYANAGALRDFVILPVINGGLNWSIAGDTRIN